MKRTDASSPFGERASAETSSAICFFVLIDLGLCVRIDERHLDAITARCA